MLREPQETDVLVPFEINNIPDEYRNYYSTKRHNLFAMIQQHRELWSYYQMLDQILHRELHELIPSKNLDAVLPLAFYINAHAKIRIAIELGLQGCMQECRSLLRDAVEWTAYGHYILGDPALLKVWFEKNDAGAEKIFKQRFEKDKKVNLFKGLPALHEKYGQLSEAGSHPTPSSLCSRVVFGNSNGQRGIRVFYSGVPDHKAWETELFSRLLTCYVIEDTIFSDFESTYKQDVKLMSMRNEFGQHKEIVRQSIIHKYEIKDPSVTT